MLGRGAFSQSFLSLVSIFVITYIEATNCAGLSVVVESLKSNEGSSVYLTNCI